MTRQTAWRRGCGTAAILAGVLWTGAASGAAPDWVAAMGRAAAAFPAAGFVTGFGMSPADRDMPQAEKIAYARNMAAGALVNSLTVTVNSEDVVDRFSRTVNRDEELVEDFRSHTTLKSRLNLDGLRFEDYVGGAREPAYALAVLDRVQARDHYRARMTARLADLAQTQGEANALLEAGRAGDAREAYARCDRLVGEIEQLLLIRELLGDRTGLSPEDLARLQAVRRESRAAWDRRAETMEEAAELLARRLGTQAPGPATVQVNAPMLEDAYQYSQFSSRFRTLLESALSRYTELAPLTAAEQEFQPGSAGLARQGAAARGADLLLTGSYFLKADGLRCCLRLATVGQGAVAAAADVELGTNAVAGVETRPRNYLEALQDRRVFGSRDLVGGGLNLEVWTSRGVDGLAVEEGSELRLYARVNKPCYLRFIYHLANGARVVPDPLYLNYYLGDDKVNKVIELPGEFEACAPFGSETMQFFASTEEFPPLPTVKRVFEGETYDVLGESLAESNTRHRGLRRKATEVEVAEIRLPLTTVPR